MLKPIQAALLVPLVGASAAVAIAAGCSTSASTGSGATQPCQNPTAGEVACDTCTAQQCGAAVNGLAAACPDFHACLEGCDCSDATCISACSDAVTETCQDAMNAYACAPCETECGGGIDTDAGDAGGPAVAPFDGTVPSGLPTTCTNGVYAAVLGGISGFCNGDAVYLICFVSSWTEYECSLPTSLVPFVPAADGGSDAANRDAEVQETGLREAGSSVDASGADAGSGSGSGS